MPLRSQGHALSHVEYECDQLGVEMRKALVERDEAGEGAKTLQETLEP